MGDFTLYRVVGPVKNPTNQLRYSFTYATI
jgi:hypothetical protein